MTYSPVARICALCCIISCCFASQTRRNSDDSVSSDIPKNYNNEKWPLWKKIVVWSSVVLLVLSVITFILIWVVFPIVFWLSIAVERYFMFIPANSPKDPKFNHPEEYGMKDTLNFYVTVVDYYNNKTVTKIGAWLILPEGETLKSNTNYVDIIKNTKHDILFYFHGVAANRAKPVWQYNIFREEFLVIAIDHRGYGDSGPGVIMGEDAIVNDHLQIFDWLRNLNSERDIYYWGHSLGTALSCHTVKALKETKGFVPKGLILESPFTNMTEEVLYSKLGKLFKWLPYYHHTVVRPLDYNGFHFNSAKNILSVDCPILIMHAEDDNVIPSFLGETLANIAKTERNETHQGSVTFHLFPSHLGYGHNDITHDSAVPDYIREFKETCRGFIPPPIKRPTSKIIQEKSH